MESLERWELGHGDGRRLFVYDAYTGEPLPADSHGGEWPALHLRHDALRDSWVAISPARNTRPHSAPTLDRPAPSRPLCMGGPQPPASTSGEVADDWHLSFEFLPPNRGPDKLTTWATVETAAGLFINDTVPEAPAAALAAVSTPLDGAAGAPFPDLEVVPTAGLAGTVRT